MRTANKATKVNKAVEKILAVRGKTIRNHVRDFIAKREAPAVIPNDGKQTSTKGAIVRWTMFGTDRAGGETIQYLLLSTQPQLAVGRVSASGIRFSRRES